MSDQYRINKFGAVYRIVGDKEYMQVCPYPNEESGCGFHCPKCYEIDKGGKTQLILCSDIVLFKKEN